MRKKIPLTPELERAYNAAAVEIKSHREIPVRCPHCGSSISYQSQARNLRYGGHGTPSSFMCRQDFYACPFMVIAPFLDPPLIGH